MNQAYQETKNVANAVKHEAVLGLLGFRFVGLFLIFSSFHV